MSLPNEAIWYHPDGYDTGVKKLMGRQAAGESFLKAYANDPELEEFCCVTPSQKMARVFAKHMRRLNGRPNKVRWFDAKNPQGLERVGTLYYPSPVITDLAWQRRRHNQRAYSLCGVFHTTASHSVMSEISEFLLAPLQPWDAVVCTSRSVKSMVNNLLEHWGEYIAARTGGKAIAPLQLPVIPLGVNSADFNPPDRGAKRAAWRERLSIGERDICVLNMGRLSFHAKAHPIPMLLALEQAARRTRKRIHLIQAGWFSDDSIEAIFHEEMANFGPSLIPHFLDGRETEVRTEIWFAADIFTALSDNIQETYGLVPLEAMSAGLPVVVSDWDGYRDTVRDGVDGIRVPTWQPRAGAGIDLAEYHADDRINYDHYVGTTSQCTVVEVQACADAYVQLIDSPELRRQMGEAGRRRAMDNFDWRHIIAEYRNLWAELAERRLGGTEELAPCPAGVAADPRREDPFVLFSSYPTRVLDEQTRVTLAGGVGPGMLPLFQESGLFRLRSELRGGDTLASGLLQQLAAGPQSARELMASNPTHSMAVMLRALGWLAKCGLVTLKAG